MDNQLLINADVGEGMPNDAKLMPYLSYANIACGGHFGNAETISKTILLAKKNNVKVGAHPSYPDTENFGRKTIDISKETLGNSLKQQIDLCVTQCKLQNIKMNHVKLHGALYTDIFNSEENTRWFLNWIQNNYPKTLVFVPVSAALYIPEEQKAPILMEVFGDRNYNNNLTLVPRGNSKAIITSINLVKKHVSAILEGKIITIEGSRKNITANTLCIHGDHALALEIVKALYLLIK